MPYSRQMWTAALIFVLSGAAAPPLAAGNEAQRRIRAGRYTGASQLMIVGDKGRVTYDDHPMSICQIEISDRGDLKAEFPSPTLGRGKWRPVTLKVSKVEPRRVWTSSSDGATYQVTAIPYSPRAYIFRLEVKNKGQLVAGAQQFYAVDVK